MVTTLVVNASPLIALAKAGLIGLLESDAFFVRVPEPVAREVRNGLGDPADRWLRGAGNTKIVPAPPVDPLLLAWDLGAGETSVIADAAQCPQSIVVLDDLAARRCAQAMGQRCTGTLGLLLMSKRRGLLPAVMPAVEKLREAGLFLGDGLVQATRVAAGE